MKGTAIACLAAFCATGLAVGTPIAGAKEVEYEGELTSGTPVDGIVIATQMGARGRSSF